MGEDIKDLKTNNIKIFIKNLVLEFLLTIVFLMILSVLLSSTNLNENVINPSIVFISAFSILIGSFFSSRKIGKKGILVGLLQGFVYILTLYLFSSISNGDFSLGISSLIMILICIICGIIGGILGVNILK